MRRRRNANHSSAALPQRQGRASSHWPALVALSIVLGACDRPPGLDSAKEWTPNDHDHADEKGKVQSGNSSGARAPKGASSGAAKDDAALVELTWQKRCAVCHGPAGHGDGPNGPMVKAPDLTLADWQAKASDADIAAVIANGKGLMPKQDLPPEVVRGLIARIRASKGR